MRVIWLDSDGDWSFEFERPFGKQLKGVVHNGDRPDIIEIGSKELLTNELTYVIGYLDHVLKCLGPNGKIIIKKERTKNVDKGSD